MRTLIASEINLSEEDGVAVAAFSQEQPHGASYLILQVSLAPDDQDRKLGIDGLYVELNNQANGAYSAISMIQVVSNGLKIHMTESGLEVLKTDCVHVEIDKAQIENVANFVSSMTGRTDVMVQYV